MKMKKTRIFLFGLLSLLLIMNSAFSLDSMFSDKGSNVKQAGALVSGGNLTIEIYDESDNLVYTEDFLSSINNGAWSVFLGYSKNLTLEYGKKYFKTYYVNGEKMNYTYQNVTSSKVPFYSPFGNVNSSYIKNTSWLDSNDQRYNETTIINSVDLSLQNEISARQSVGNWSGDKYNYYNKTEVDSNSASTLKNSGSQTLNGNLTINGDLSLIGSMIMIGQVLNLSVTNIDTNGSINPAYDNMFSLGGVGFKWNAVYANHFYGKINASDVENAPWITSYTESDPSFTSNNIKLMGFNTTAELDNRYLQSYTESDPTVDANKIKNLGFNTTSELDNKYLLVANAQEFNETSLINAKHSPSNCPSGQVVQNTTSNGVECIVPTSNVYTNGSGLDLSGNTFSVNNNYLQQFNETALINNKLDSNDQRYNESGVIASVNSSLQNEIVARQSLGNWSTDKANYNTTSQLDNKYYAINNPNSYLNISTAQVFNDSVNVNSVNASLQNEISARQSIGNWSADKSGYNTTAQLDNKYLDVNDQRFNDTVAIGLKLDVNDQRYNGSAQIVSVNGSLNTEINNRVNNDSNLQTQINNLFTNDSNLDNKIVAVNTSANFKSFGFNLTSELKSYFDGLYYSIGNALGFINQSQADARYLQLTDQRYNDTVAIGLKLDSNDQRYNETTLLNSVNASLQTEINTRQSIGNWSADKIDYYNKTEVYNKTEINNLNITLQNQITILQNNQTFQNINGDATFTTGNIGIGTTFPTQKIDVNGSINVSGSGAKLYFSDGTFMNSSANVSSRANTGYIPKMQSSTILNNSIIYQNGTKIGIGTTSPRGILDIVSGTNNINGDGAGEVTIIGPDYPWNGQSRANLQIGTNENQQVDFGGTIGFGGRYMGSSAQATFAIIKGAKENGTSGDYAGYLSFYTRPSGGGTMEMMRINSNGNVGIGTTSPVAKLQVNGGNIWIGNNTDGSTRIEWNATNNISSLRSAKNGAVETQLAFWTQTSAGSFAEKMRINGDGNVGIGTNSPNSKLEVNGTINLTGNIQKINFGNGGYMYDNGTALIFGHD